MKKWRSLANPLDPGNWADVSNMWPTARGSYETADYYTTSADITATGETGIISAWAFNGVSSTKVYVIGKYLWSLDTSLNTATDRTGALGASAVAEASGGHACQYGDVTIVTRGTSASLIYATTGNFAALAGSPNARFVVSQSNALVAFNTGTNSDAWHASDVGDYTNWTTGEAASGRILENSGPITGAIAYGSDIIVFKEDSIFRMTYVGGITKWTITKIYQGLGLSDRQAFGGSVLSTGKSNGCSAVVDTSAGLFFPGSIADSGYQWYLFDGASPPRCVTFDIEAGSGIGTPVYDSATQTVTIFGYGASGINTLNTRYYYNIVADAWGKSSTSAAGIAHSPIRGPSAAIGYILGGASINRQYLTTGTDKIVRNYAVGANTSGSPPDSYIQTHKISAQGNELLGEAQFTFGPAAPVLRNSSSFSSANLSLTVDVFNNANDTSAAATSSVSMSTIRNRFDFAKAGAFCKLKLSLTGSAQYIEVDDISVVVKPSGKI